MAGPYPANARPATAPAAGPQGRTSVSGGLFRISLVPGGCWRVCGEIDLRNDDEWTAALDRIVSGGAGVRLDLVELEFISARGVAQLVSASERLPAGERIEVINPRPLFRRILDLCWPTGVSGLQVVERTQL
jgi:anti-anti-sigma factor